MVQKQTGYKIANLGDATSVLIMIGRVLCGTAADLVDWCWTANDVKGSKDRPQWFRVVPADEGGGLQLKADGTRRARVEIDIRILYLLNATKLGFSPKTIAATLRTMFGIAKGHSEGDFAGLDRKDFRNGITRSEKHIATIMERAEASGIRQQSGTGTILTHFRPVDAGLEIWEEAGSMLTALAAEAHGVVFIDEAGNHLSATATVERLLDAIRADREKRKNAKAGRAAKKAKADAAEAVEAVEAADGVEGTSEVAAEATEDASSPASLTDVFSPKVLSSFEVCAGREAGTAEEVLEFLDMAAEFYAQAMTEGSAAEPAKSEAV